MKCINFVAALAAALLLTLGAAHPVFATPLTMQLNDSPDMMASVSTIYDSSSDLLMANGTVVSYDNGGGATYDYFGARFMLGAFIDENGTLSSGALVIVDPWGTTLLTGNLFNFGYAEGDPTMQFLFNNVGGSLASDFGPLLFVTLNFTGFQDATDGFRSDFYDYSGMGTSDVQAPAVPEPGTVSLVLAGAGALLAARRRSSAARS